jgi:hypothetical protein
MTNQMVRRSDPAVDPLTGAEPGKAERGKLRSARLKAKEPDFDGHGL